MAVELIQNRSGVGSMVTVADLNGNGALDIITSTNRGTFVFLGQAIFSSHRSREKVLMDAAN